VAAEALAQEDIELARSAAGAAETAAKAAKQAPLVIQAGSRLTQIDSLRKELEAVQAARRTLETRPEDPEAALVLGRYLAFRKGTWDEGLTMLAKGSDPGLREAARRDQSSPASPESQAELGDTWFQMAERAQAPGEKRALQSRAKKWYELGVGGLAGLAKLRVQKRLDGISPAPAPSGSGKDVNLLALVVPAQDQVVGTWTLEAGALASPADVAHALVQIPYRPPEEYDLTLEMERTNGTGSLDLGLVAGAARFLVVLDGWGDHSCGIERIDGKDSNANESTTHAALGVGGQRDVVVCSVRRTSLTVRLNGVEIIRWKADYGRVSLTGVYVPRTAGTLFLGTMTARYLIRSLLLLPVTGEGKPLR